MPRQFVTGKFNTKVEAGQRQSCFFRQFSHSTHDF